MHSINSTFPPTFAANIQFVRVIFKEFDHDFGNWRSKLLEWVWVQLSNMQQLETPAWKSDYHELFVQFTLNHCHL